MNRHPEKQLPEIPFDVAEWGDKELPWPNGLFTSQDEYDDAATGEPTTTDPAADVGEHR